MTSEQVYLLFPQDLIEPTQDALAHHKQLDKTLKIRNSPPKNPVPLPDTEGNLDINSDADTYLIPTTTTTTLTDAPLNPLEHVRTALKEDTDAQAPHCETITAPTTPHIPHLPPRTTTNKSAPPSPPKPTPLTTALNTWLHALPTALLPSLALTTTALLATFPKPHTIYPPLLLLPPQTFTAPPWPLLLAALRPAQLRELYARLAAGMRVSHVAINAPIPAVLDDGGDGDGAANVMRRPTRVRPLYGDFGPVLPASRVPGVADFEGAFWVSARQNGVYQTWAPVHTMFSRGNISEKARIMRLPTLGTCLSGGGAGPGRWEGKCAAVDLYAGIGYFAFSYARAEGVGRVVGWEVCGWSVEGLRRGAVGNGWGVKVVDWVEGDGEVDLGGEEKIVVFREDNVNALRRIERMRDRLPPVRHVNCGLLPTSRASWEVAVGVLDPVEGGWIHAHENIAVKDVESTKDDIVKTFTKLANGDEQDTRNQRSVECQHLERVKSYAPGVMHCVLDIYLPPPTPISPVQEG